MLTQKKILIGITGSIAAYKTASLIRLLVKEGALVKVIMTHAAANFISPLTISTLAKSGVLIDIFDNDQWNNHVLLGRWADVMLLAPLSGNTLAKMASGVCDNLLMAVYLSAACPVLAAPAMDEDMWNHPATRRNIQQVEANGTMVLNVNKGELASGLSGEGRMREPEELIADLKHFFHNRQQLKGRKVLITAGPTYEALDPVRFIGNHSSGKMGLALATEAANRGADVHLVIGPTALDIPGNLRVEKVISAEEMLQACLRVFPSCDFAIMSAAVADYTPGTVAREKIKKDDGELTIQLKKTTDILKTLGSMKKENQVVVGFALETNNEKENALKKIAAKNADYIILNSLRDKGAGFQSDTNKITIFDKQGKEIAFEMKSKSTVARDILDVITKSYEI